MTNELLGNLELNRAYQMDCIEGMKLLPDNSISSIVTDPPYELGFMGKSWDSTGIAYNIELWKECLRVLKSGGHLLAFGGTRTYHRMAVAIEDAGFEIRDQIQWIYGSGFPKSQNISKAIDKKFGTGSEEAMGCTRITTKNGTLTPAIELSKQWEGWGTALKPANEPIVLARKPLSEKTIVDNVVKWGVGGLNIEDSKVKGIATPENEKGRFPSNVILDEWAGRLLDEQSGVLKSGGGSTGNKIGGSGMFGNGKVFKTEPRTADTGGASRFFYCAKAKGKEKGESNIHPTVKPIKLMEYLVKLATPTDGIVLDPFCGSGTTLIASKMHGINFIGFDSVAEYIDITNRRLGNFEGSIV